MKNRLYTQYGVKNTHYYDTYKFDVKELKICCAYLQIQTSDLVDLVNFIRANSNIVLWNIHKQVFGIKHSGVHILYPSLTSFKNVTKAYWFSSFSSMGAKELRPIRTSYFSIIVP